MTDRIVSAEKKLYFPLRLLTIVSLGLAGCYPVNENVLNGLDRQCRSGVAQASASFELFPGDTLYVGWAKIIPNGQGKADIDINNSGGLDIVGVNGEQTVEVGRRVTVSTAPGEKMENGIIPTEIKISQSCPAS